MQGREILRKLTRSSAPIKHLKLVVHAKGIKYHEDFAKFHFGYCEKYDGVTLLYLKQHNVFLVTFYKGDFTEYNMIKWLNCVPEDKLTSTFQDVTGLML